MAQQLADHPLRIHIMTRRIMVVDDELGALTLIGIMLERGGFEVLKARNAFEALDILKNQTPDLIILDVMMPGMDGIELCRRIRADRKSTRLNSSHQLISYAV